MHTHVEGRRSTIRYRMSWAGEIELTEPSEYIGLRLLTEALRVGLVQSPWPCTNYDTSEGDWPVSSQRPLASWN